jgi:hypothetical protein
VSDEEIGEGCVGTDLPCRSKKEVIRQDNAWSVLGSVRSPVVVLAEGEREMRSKTE